MTLHSRLHNTTIFTTSSCDDVKKSFSSTRSTEKRLFKSELPGSKLPVTPARAARKPN